MLCVSGRGIFPYVLGRSDLRKTFVAAGHSSCLCSFLPSLALLKGFCTIQILLTLTVGFCVLTVSEQAVADHTDAHKLVLVYTTSFGHQCSDGLWSFDHGLSSLLEMGRAALGLLVEVARADRPVCISECSTQLPEANCWWR